MGCHMSVARLSSGSYQGCHSSQPRPVAKGSQRGGSDQLKCAPQVTCQQCCCISAWPGQVWLLCTRGDASTEEPRRFFLPEARRLASGGVAAWSALCQCSRRAEAMTTSLALCWHGRWHSWPTTHDRQLLQRIICCMSQPYYSGSGSCLRLRGARGGAPAVNRRIHRQTHLLGFETPRARAGAAGR